MGYHDLGLGDVAERTCVRELNQEINFFFDHAARMEISESLAALCMVNLRGRGSLVFVAAQRTSTAEAQLKVAHKEDDSHSKTLTPRLRESSPRYTTA